VPFVFVIVTALLGLDLAHGYERRPFIIAVAGGSASGKTFNAKLLVEALGPERATLVSADDYYAPERQAPEFHRNGRINYDHPSAVDLKTLGNHLSYLRAGFPVQVTEYTYGRKVEVPKPIVHEPREFVVVEGIFALYPEIARLVDYRVFVDVDRETRLRRRLVRDQKERGLKPEDIVTYFNEVVEPMHRTFVQRSALNADFILHSPEAREEVAQLVALVEDQAKRLRRVKTDVMIETYEHALREAAASDPSRFAVRPIDEIYPSQSSLGFLALSNKSDLIDTIVRETALNPERASDLTNYLIDNPVPLIDVDQREVATDHHHLVVALRNKGIREVLTTPTDPATVDPERLEWIRSQPTPLTFAALRNDPMRSLASMVRDLGYVKKTGEPHEEFRWADYYRDRLKDEHQIVVSEAMLLSTDDRRRIVDLAIAMARVRVPARCPVGRVGVTDFSPWARPGIARRLDLSSRAYDAESWIENTTSRSTHDEI
jgi:uridine kinase